MGESSTAENSSAFMRCISISLIGTKGREKAKWRRGGVGTEMNSKSCSQLLTGLVTPEDARDIQC